MLWLAARVSCEFGLLGKQRSNTARNICPSPEPWGRERGHQQGVKSPLLVLQHWLASRILKVVTNGLLWQVRQLAEEPAMQVGPIAMGGVCIVNGIEAATRVGRFRPLGRCVGNCRCSLPRVD